MRTVFSPHLQRIFAKFGGNFSLTLKGSLIPLTQWFRNCPRLFWNATGVLGGGQTKREQASRSVNRKLRKVLLAQA
jgi:hypothetical protein